jgi:hypothetical protein
LVRIDSLEVAMTAHNALAILEHELEFLDKGGYDRTVGSRQPAFCMETSADWKPPVIFEDSPVCPKRKYCECNAESDCVLMSLVPMEHRREMREILPCHYIPLNEAGDTISSLSKTVSHDKLESVLRNWLVKNIEKLEPASRSVVAAK